MILNYNMKSQVQKLVIENDQKEKIIHDQFLQRNKQIKEQFELDMNKSRDEYKLERDKLRCILKKKVKRVKLEYHTQIECACGDTVKLLNIDKHHQSKTHNKYLLNEFMKKINKINLDNHVLDCGIKEMNDKVEKIVEEYNKI